MCIASMSFGFVMCSDSYSNGHLLAHMYMLHMLIEIHRRLLVYRCPQTKSRLESYGIKICLKGKDCPSNVNYADRFLHATREPQPFRECGEARMCKQPIQKLLHNE